MAKPPIEPETSKSRGRPRADEPGSSVSTWLRQAEHDKLIRLANQREQSISAMVRSLLILRLR